MPAVSADRKARTGRPLLWVAGLVLLALVAGFFVLGASDREVIRPAAPAQSPVAAEPSRESAAAEMLVRLSRALSSESSRQATALAAPGQPGARRQLAWIHGNVRELGVADLALRFVDESSVTVNSAERRKLGSGAWVGDVEVRWRLAGFDSTVSTMEVPFTFVDTEDGVAMGSVGGGDEAATPLWMLDDLTVRRGGRTLVAVAGGGDVARYAALADEAVRDVRAVLPRWRGRLVVQVPADEDQLGQVLNAEAGAYQAIAAVTATVDGSMVAESPVHILVNPEVLGGLGREGSQIVMSHEATHVAVGAATSTMPLWLLEGFADYVALARADLPVSMTASQILEQVRRQGPPEALPGTAEFDPGNKHLGTSYEAAWLACRLLAEEYGEPRLLEFYDQVDAGASVSEAFASLGITEVAFTRRWRRHLSELAG